MSAAMSVKTVQALFNHLWLNPDYRPGLKLKRLKKPDR